MNFRKLSKLASGFGGGGDLSKLASGFGGGPGIFPGIPQDRGEKPGDLPRNSAGQGREARGSSPEFRRTPAAALGGEAKPAESGTPAAALGGEAKPAESGTPGKFRESFAKRRKDGWK